VSPGSASIARIVGTAKPSLTLNLANKELSQWNWASLKLGT